ncbi:MAG: hypothetical protein IJ192_11035 [Clostridia bacterium]|nr:hypothetical protein [Clostridia bacterium]
MTLKSESNTIIYTSDLTKDNYMGSGYYAGRLNPKQANQVKHSLGLSMAVIVKSGVDDITDTLTICDEDVIQWYDKLWL